MPRRNRSRGRLGRSKRKASKQPVQKPRDEKGRFLASKLLRKENTALKPYRAVTRPARNSALRGRVETQATATGSAGARAVPSGQRPLRSVERLEGNYTTVVNKAVKCIRKPDSRKAGLISARKRRNGKGAVSKRERTRAFKLWC